MASYWQTTTEIATAAAVAACVVCTHVVQYSVPPTQPSTGPGMLLVHGPHVLRQHLFTPPAACPILLLLWTLQLQTCTLCLSAPPPQTCPWCPRARKRRERPRDKRRRAHRELVAQRKWERDNQEWRPETLASEWGPWGHMQQLSTWMCTAGMDPTWYCLVKQVAR